MRWADPVLARTEKIFRVFESVGLARDTRDRIGIAHRATQSNGSGHHPHLQPSAVRTFFFARLLWRCRNTFHREHRGNVRENQTEAADPNGLLHCKMAARASTITALFGRSLFFTPSHKTEVLGEPGGGRSHHELLALCQMDRVTRR